MGFLTELSQKNEVDRVGVSQLFLLGYPLGDRTLLLGKSRFSYASLILADPRRRKISVERLHEFNFDGAEYRSRSVEDNAENLVELFLAGCRNRITSDSKNVLGLSGGLDSRAVGAALCRRDPSLCYICWPTPRFRSRRRNRLQTCKGLRSGVETVSPLSSKGKGLAKAVENQKWTELT